MVFEKEVETNTAIEELQTWIRTQQHLPQTILRVLLKRYYLASKMDMDRAKKLIEKSYQLRNNHPHIFFERDPLTSGIELALKVTDQLPLPMLTPEKRRILFYRLADLDPKNYHFDDVIRTFFIVSDVRLSIPDATDDQGDFVCSGEIPIFDMAGFSWRHATKAVISTLRLYMKYTQECSPVTLNSIHLINCPPFVDRVFMIVRPFLKKEVSKMIHFHLPDSETLNEHVPKEVLPVEYGGSGGSMSDIKQDWMKKIKSSRDYLMDQKNWKIDESKRKGGATALNQGIRSLSID